MESPTSRVAIILRALDYEPSIRHKIPVKDEPPFKAEAPVKVEYTIKEEDYSPRFIFPDCPIEGDPDDPSIKMLSPSSTGPPDPGPPRPLKPPPGPHAPFEPCEDKGAEVFCSILADMGYPALSRYLFPIQEEEATEVPDPTAHDSLPAGLRSPFCAFDNRVSSLLGVSDHTVSGDLNWQNRGTSDPEEYVWSLRHAELGGQRVETRGDGEVTRMGAGESYRPTARARSPGSPPRASTFRPDRDRSPRRDRARTPISDSYHPRARSPPRRRSRSPPYRRDRSPLRENSYRGRPRSPTRARSPPRARSPIRARSPTRPRSPPRARSPIRARSPPRARSLIRTRSPPRVRSPLPPRPRSPPRVRSPPRRFSPRRDNDRRERPRSPRRDERRHSRSPYDQNRGLPSRARSPMPARRLSPPNGPRGAYRRSISPPRRDDRTQPGPVQVSGRRPLSPSPAVRDSERSSGATSGSTSRRSSPPVHPNRLPLTQAAIRDAPRARSPPSRARSPLLRVRSPQPSSRDRSPFQSTNSQRNAVPPARSTPRDRSPVRPVAPRSPPKGPAAFRAPTGPSSRHLPSVSPAPSSSTPVSAHNRLENAGPVVPPAGPRGYNPSARGAYSSRGGRGSFGSDRQPRPDATSWGSASLSRPVEAVSKPALRPAPTSTPSALSAPSAPSVFASTSIPTGPASIPTGPRAGPVVSSRPPIQHSSTVYSSRSSQPTTPSGLRPHPAMANMPQIVPGGRIDPAATGIPADMATRLARRKEEEEVLREELKIKEERLRQNLKVWDRLSRESASMSLKTELSERHVRQLAGEGVGGAAF